MDHGIKYSLINMRQLHFNPKLDIRLFVDLAEFTCFYQFLHDVSNHEIVLQIKTKHFYDHIMQELVKSGKSS